ncbi:MAG: prepilin-type N-terminal cleavage/methylation domain-containing protein [Myxococcota bacterium]|jgi:prepilin-type N-terminal cleavage/methylation domain-containing protein|nr:prepilin-type N-terminal cleavage/methylation domain-containing protein [Myxococcota bacterium]
MLGAAMRNLKRRKTKGFTIVELMIVITVIALLATVVLPGLIAQNQEKLVERMSNDFKTLEQAVLVYYIQEGVWPELPCDDVIDQAGLEDNGFLGQVLFDPRGDDDADHRYRITGNNDTPLCRIQISTNTDDGTGYPPETMHTALEASISGLKCFESPNRCRKFLTESQIADFSGGGDDGEAPEPSCSEPYNIPLGSSQGQCSGYIQDIWRIDMFNAAAVCCTLH